MQSHLTPPPCRAQVEQALRQRDKLLQDLDLSDLRNLQLVREVDEHQASVESLNQSRIRWGSKVAASFLMIRGGCTAATDPAVIGQGAGAGLP